MTKIKLLVEHGTARAGDIFIRGDYSFGVPDYYKGKSTDKEWFWKQGSEKRDSEFLPSSCFTDELKDNFSVLEN